MSRSHSDHHSNMGSNAVVVNVLQNIVSKQNQYKDASKTNHSLCKTLAVRLRRDATSLQASLSAQNVVPNDEIEIFMNKQREKLKKLAETNIDNERMVDTFVAAVGSMRVSIENGSSDGSNPTMRDYKALLQEMMEKTKQARQATQIEINQETYYREILQGMGEALPPPAKKRGRGNDDEDDVECIPTAGSQQRSLKCPITAQLLEQPVKSKVCHHVYSKAAIEDYLRGGCKRCPVAGCSNNALHLGQLDPDRETEILVKRMRHHEKSQSLQRASQANGIDSDEEEFR